MAYGFTSLKHAAKNIGGAVDFGMNIGMGSFKGIGSTLPTNFASIGGAATLGGGTVVGAAAGAHFGSVSDGDPSTMEGAAIGAAIGTAALPAVGLAAATGYHIANNFDKIGTAGINTAKGALNVAAGIGKTLNETSIWKNPIGGLASTAQKAMGALISHTPKREVWNTSKNAMETKGGTSLSKIGWGAAGLAVAADAVFGAKKAFEESRMGRMDERIVTNAPSIPSYKDNAGASGDLVFALNANRRG